MARRPLPRVGAAVEVEFLAATVRGTVDAVHDEGRRLVVVTEEGETLEFVLSRATGLFSEGGSQTGARLRFVSLPPEDPRGG